MCLISCIFVAAYLSSSHSHVIAVVWVCAKYKRKHEEGLQDKTQGSSVERRRWKNGALGESVNAAKSHTWVSGSSEFRHATHPGQPWPPSDLLVGQRICGRRVIWRASLGAEASSVSSREPLPPSQRLSHSDRLYKGAIRSDSFKFWRVIYRKGATIGRDLDVKARQIIWISNPWLTEAARRKKSNITPENKSDTFSLLFTPSNLKLTLKSINTSPLRCYQCLLLLTLKLDWNPLVKNFPITYLENFKAFWPKGFSHNSISHFAAIISCQSASIPCHSNWTHF